MRGAVLGVLGVGLAALSLLMIAAGLGILWLGDWDGTVGGDRGTVATPTRALVASPATVVAGYSDVAGGEPHVRVTLTAPEGRRMFLGVGPAAQVDAWLRDVQHEVATSWDVSPLVITGTTVAGVRDPGDPSLQDFWTQTASRAGQTLSLDLRLREPDAVRVVVMNADGAPGVAAEGAVTLDVPTLHTAGIVVTVVGGLALLVSLALAALGFGRARAARLAAEASPPPTG